MFFHYWIFHYCDPDSQGSCMSLSSPLFIILTASGLQFSGKEMYFSDPDHTLDTGGREISCGLDITGKRFCWDFWVHVTHLGCAFEEQGSHVCPLCLGCWALAPLGALTHFYVENECLIYSCCAEKKDVGKQDRGDVLDLIASVRRSEPPWFPSLPAGHGSASAL